jgi:hypothetical protein
LPGATLLLVAAIDPQGAIVGRYDRAGKSHGYLLSRGELTTIDIPEAGFTVARSINPRGDIVGIYMTAGMFHGYLLSGLERH